MAVAMKKHPDVDVLINFASFRSAAAVSKEALSFDQIRTVRRRRVPCRRAVPCAVRRHVSDVCPGGEC